MVSIAYELPALARNTFRGLPGLLADSLPDKYGNAIIDAWLASQNRTAAGFHPVERLCYVGSRGMGALEFEPATLAPPNSKRAVEVSSLVDFVNQIFDERASLGGVFSGDDDREAINDILRVGTSAGGARAKAILAWNPETNECRCEAVRRTLGLVLVAMALLFVFHAKFAYFFPGLLGGPEYSWSRLGAFMYLYDTGMFGMILGLAGSIVIVFLVFGCLMTKGGAADFFMDLALGLTGRFRGGLPKSR